MRFAQTLFFTCLCVFSPYVHSAGVDGIRSWAGPDATRVVLDITQPVEHKLFTLTSPHRVVLDLEGASMAQSVASAFQAKGVVSDIRYAEKKDGTVRIVFDLSEEVRPKSFLIKPNATYGHRLVVDLERSQQSASAPVAKTAKETINVKSDFVVAIDPGHGGEDPGAIGATGSHEKQVVLQIAKRLEKKINAEPGMKAVLTRDGDYYVGLRKRMNIARLNRADVFISLHADAFTKRSVKGSSVYTLSRKGASSEAARWLADQENAADLVGGVSLDDKDNILATVLLDLSQSATNESSVALGKDILSNLRGIGPVHKSTVQHAGFMVLKAPDIPSILIETAFISNPSEEKKLRSSRYQQQLVGAVFKGLKSYSEKYRFTDMRLASVSQHVISSGDTLSGIARQYSTSIEALRQVNNIRGDQLRVGQVLTIPVN